MSTIYVNKYNSYKYNIDVDNKSLGFRLQDARIDKRLKQREVAEKIGVHQATLSTYEHNVAKPSIDVLIKLAKLYDVSLDYLCGLKDY